MQQSYYCYDRIELKVNSDITSVRFTYADGAYETAYPFDSQPISIAYDAEGIEHIKKDGDIQRCIRYTPTKPGMLVAQMYDGDCAADSFSLSILPADNHGYIRVSGTDKRYFEYTDGTPFVPVGINMVYPTAYPDSSGNEFGVTNVCSYIGINQYKSWFRKAAENGVNMVRLWLGHEYFNPDTENAYILDLVQLAKIDRVIELAKEFGLTLKLTIENFRHFSYDKVSGGGGYNDYIFRLFNKRLFSDGKKCEDMEQWLEDEEFANAWLFKVSEIAKRYAGDTAVFAVELWNEMNAVGAPFEKTLEWNKKYLPKVKALFPENMVTNSLGSMDAEYAVKQYNEFCWDKADFKQMHRYLDRGASYEVCGINPIELIQDGMRLLRTKSQPLVLAETGAVNNCHSGPFRYYSADDDGLIFADCVYTPFFCEGAGCGQIWHWDDRYVESKSLFKMFKPFSAMLKGVDVTNESFVSKDLSDDNAYILVLEGKNYVLGYVRNKTSDWKWLLRDLKDVSEIEELSIELDGLKAVELIKIWDDNSSAKMTDGGICIKNLHHGVMFKARKVQDDTCGLF